VLRARLPGLQVAQIADAMPAQTAVEPRARDIRIQELAHHRQQVVERHQQRLAQRHGDGLLRRRQGRLQPMRRVAAIRNTVALAPFVDRLRIRQENDPPDRFLVCLIAKALGQNRPGLVTLLDRRAHPGRRRSLLVKMDQHGRPPSRMSLRTDLAMKRADRRGEM
jgi:hypothetical protein